jgi:hypothetical protein
MTTKKTKLHLVNQSKLTLKNRAKCGNFYDLVCRYYSLIFVNFSIEQQNGSKITDFLKLDQPTEIKQHPSKELAIKRFPCQYDKKSKVSFILQSQINGRFPPTLSWQQYLTSFQVVL